VKKTALAAAAAAIAISSMVATPMAHADSETCIAPADGDCEPTWQAIAYSPSTGTLGEAWDQYRDYARSRAKHECDKDGATDCFLAASAEEDCVALAVDDATGNSHGGVGNLPQDADNDALAKTGGGKVIKTVCQFGPVG
jgi:hypothetical protein